MKVFATWGICNYQMGIWERYYCFGDEFLMFTYSASYCQSEVEYVCGKCKQTVGKNDLVCNHCGAMLGNIRCDFCNQSGSVDEFINDICPDCGKKKPAKINYTGSKHSTKQKKTDLIGTYFWYIFGSLIILAAGIVGYLYFRT